jgi:CBS domain-containing protein
MVQEPVVSDFMSSPVVTVLPSISLVDAVSVMVRKKIGNLVVVEKEKPLGILTEREILRYLSLNKELPSVPVEQLPLQRFVKLVSSTSIVQAAKAMIATKSRLLVF